MCVEGNETKKYGTPELGVPYYVKLSYLLVLNDRDVLRLWTFVAANNCKFYFLPIF